MALHPALGVLGLYRSLDLERYVKNELGYTRLRVSRARLAETLNLYLNKVIIPHDEFGVNMAIHDVIKYRCNRHVESGYVYRVVLKRHRLRTRYPTLNVEDLDINNIAWKRFGTTSSLGEVIMNDGQRITILTDDVSNLPGREFPKVRMMWKNKAI